MKNRLITLLAVGFSIGIISNNNCRPRKYDPRQNQSPVPTSQGRRSVPATSPSTTAATTQKKLDQSTKQLTDAEKAYKNAKTPEQKMTARKMALAEAKDVVQYILEERNIQGELLGYGEEQKEAADDILFQLRPKRAVLAEITEKVQEKWDKMTDKSWFGLSNSPKPGTPVKTWEKTTKKLDDLKAALAELDKRIREQEIIAGDIKFTKTRIAALAGLGAVVAGGVATVMYPTQVKAATMLAFSNPKAFVQTTWNNIPSASSLWKRTTAVVPTNGPTPEPEKTNYLGMIIGAPSKALSWYTEYQNMMGLAALLHQIYSTATTPAQKEKAGEQEVRVNNIIRDVEKLEDDYKDGKIPKELYEKRLEVKAKQLQQIELAIQPKKPASNAQGKPSTKPQPKSQPKPKL